MSRNHDRLSGWTWERVRRIVLDRDDWRCVECQHPGDLEVDHIVPMESGGAALDVNNLQVLCSGCHVLKTAREAGVDPERLAWRQSLREMTP